MNGRIMPSTPRIMVLLGLSQQCPQHIIIMAVGPPEHTMPDARVVPPHFKHTIVIVARNDVLDLRLELRELAISHDLVEGRQVLGVDVRNDSVVRVGHAHVVLYICFLQTLSKLPGM